MKSSVAFQLLQIQLHLLPGREVRFGRDSASQGIVGCG